MVFSHTWFDEKYKFSFSGIFVLKGWEIKICWLYGSCYIPIVLCTSEKGKKWCFLFLFFFFLSFFNKNFEMCWKPGVNLLCFVCVACPYVKCVIVFIFDIKILQLFICQTFLHFQFIVLKISYVLFFSFYLFF